MTSNNDFSTVHSPRLVECVVVKSYETKLANEFEAVKMKIKQIEANGCYRHIFSCQSLLFQPFTVVIST